MSGISQFCIERDGKVEVYIGTNLGESLTLKFARNNVTDDEIDEISRKATDLMNMVFQASRRP